MRAVRLITYKTEDDLESIQTRSFSRNTDHASSSRKICYAGKGRFLSTDFGGVDLAQGKKREKFASGKSVAISMVSNGRLEGVLYDAPADHVIVSADGIQGCFYQEARSCWAWPGTLGIRKPHDLLI